MKSSDSVQSVSTTGVIFMVVGMGMVLFEFQTDFMLRRLGLWGRGIMLACGTALSVWGLKDVIASFWPRLAGRGYHVRIPLEGWLYLLIMIVLFMGALIGRNNPLLMVFAMMVGPFVMNGWYTFTMLKGLKVSRDMPPRMMAGETLSVTLTLTNPKSWLSAWLMAVRDSVTHRSGSIVPEVLFVRVPGGRERRGHYQLRLDERGRYLLGPVNIASRFPLGLVERGLRLEAPGELLIYPRIGRLHPEWRRLLQHSAELVSHVRPQSGPFNDELHRLREYRAGDDPRRIHWRTSARMNELMVCDYQESRDRDLVLIVDAWTPHRPTADQVEQLEFGLRFAATIVMDQIRNGRASALVVHLAGKRTFQWDGDSGDHHTDELLDGFALLESSRRPIDEIFQGLENDPSRSRRTVVVTTRPEPMHAHLADAPDQFGGDVQVFGTTREELAGIYEEN
jgi:uncharacterized protein (DUF58 family)